MTGQRSFLFDYVERFEGYIKMAEKTPKPMLGYGKITDGRYIIKDVHSVNDEDGNVVLSARRNGNLYSTVFRSIPQTHPQFEALSQSVDAICLLSKASTEDSWLWHRRLCHQNFKDMNKLVSKRLVSTLPETRLSKDTLCPACEQGKMKRSSHPPKIDTNSKSPLDMSHMDLCRPMRVESLARKKYMLVLVDEFSRFTWLEFLRAKSDAADRIIAFIKRIQILLSRKVKKIRSDNDTEFRNTKLQSFLEDMGISHNFFAVRTPQQNGVVERKNRTLVEAARSMMAHSGIPQSFWAEAVSTACFTQNRTLIVKRIGKTAYEMIEQHFIDPPDYDLPTLTGPIILPAHPGSSTTFVSSDAFVIEPSSSTSTDSVTPESVVSPSENSSTEPPTVASPKPVREQTTSPVLATIPEAAPLPSLRSSQRTYAQCTTKLMRQTIFKWTRSHPSSQIIGSPSQNVQTRSSKRIDNLVLYGGFLSDLESSEVQQALFNPDQSSHSLESPEALDSLLSSVDQVRIAQPWEIGSFSLVNRRTVVKFGQRLHDSLFFNLTGGIEHRMFQGNWTSLATSKTLVSVSSLRFDLIGRVVGRSEEWVTTKAGLRGDPNSGKPLRCGYDVIGMCDCDGTGCGSGLEVDKGKAPA
ncbi:hypothetical protein OSB04_028587 [Centaurea solstitialis]|uniref:Integrase catalytic domain-containing protein n=1 Tax=Centaurea solstitialis TaxID=347529 RepID=A0AA38SSX8_9ASTR|nr:hypothetical protein OSB04_028587 [Centaurea solstitialis]